MRTWYRLLILVGIMGCGAAAGKDIETGPGNPSDPALSKNDPNDSSPDVDTDAAENTEKQGVDAPLPAPPVRPLKPTESETLLNIIVINDKGAPIPGVVITVENTEGERFISSVSDESGQLALLVPKGKIYFARFVSLDEDEIKIKVPVDDAPYGSMKLELTYTPPKTRSFVLRGVYFDTAKWILKPESYPNLENLVEFMTLKKTAHIRLEGHTDNVGDDNSNQRLSQKRAEAVRKYLIKKGIKPSRIDAVGYGESRPVASNDTEEGRETNRRTVVTVIKD